MKKTISCVLIISLLFALCACNGGKIPAKNKTGNSKTSPQDAKEEIERITDYESFETELSKHIDLSEYNCEEQSTSQDNFSYIFTHKYDIKLPDSKANYKIYIDGTEIQIPITVNELIEKGWDVVGNTDLESYYSQNISPEFKNSNGKTIKTFLTPPDDNTSVKFGDAYVSQFAFRPFHGSQQNPTCPDVTLFGSITAKSSLNDIIARLGAPAKIHYLGGGVNGRTTISQIQLIYNFGDKDIKTSAKPAGYIDGHVTFNIRSILDEGSQDYDYIMTMDYYVV